MQMLQRLFLYFSIFVTTSILCVVVNEKFVKNQVHKMPLVQNDPFYYLAYGSTPIAKRNIENRKWLAAGVKISVSGGSGSGTIIYYDDNSYAYIQSCGHLWNGSMTAEECKSNNITCKIIVWYHNDIKLKEPKTYSADVLFYSNGEGKDCSLLRFKPDWKPNFFPIASDIFQLQKDMKLHSVGCDAGGEVAHYDVRYIGMAGPDIVTTENSPRPGRSGGGLMNDSFYVGICWGTSNYDGSGNGFFTPLKTIRKYNEINGYGWLNKIGNLARQIPIIDRNSLQGSYPTDYIPLPNQNAQGSPE